MRMAPVTAFHTLPPPPLCPQVMENNNMWGMLTAESFTPFIEFDLIITDAEVAAAAAGGDKGGGDKGDSKGDGKDVKERDREKEARGRMVGATTK
jgi:hypothetical protein